MKNHVKVFMEYYGLTEADFIPSMISGKKADDIHHIEQKKMGGKAVNPDRIDNLISVTREEHDKCHRYEISKESQKAIVEDCVRRISPYS